MQARFSIVMAVAVVLAGCGSSVSGNELCTKGESTMAGLEAKVRECSGETVTFDRAACVAAAASCSPSDLEILDSFLDCLNDLPTCTVETVATFKASVDSCAGIRDGISSACRTASGS